jgi:hypothetical protein
VSARLAAAGNILSSRFLTLCPARRSGVLERLLGEIPGNLLDPPVAGRMGAALPRLPWLRETVHDRPDTTASVEDAAVELLGCYALRNGVAALTQGNLKILDGKCKAALDGSSGKPGSHKFDCVRSIGIAAQDNALGHGGDGRNRYDAVAYEGYAQYLTGNDADADTRARCSRLISLACAASSSASRRWCPSTARSRQRAHAALPDLRGALHRQSGRARRGILR